MLKTTELDVLEKRAHKARLTMAELCKAAGVAYSTVYRARVRGLIKLQTLRKLEETLFRIEREKDDGSQGRA